MADETSTVTDDQFLFANDLGSHVTIPGTIVCGLVLIAYAIVAASSTAARQHLDRVSFRLLTYSLFFNVLFGIDYTLTPAEPGRGCTLGAVFNNITLCLSTFFTTCIAINLQVVLVHRRNGKALEKYYVGGTILLTLIVNIPTVALHQFGWNEDTATCWYSNSDSRTRLSWIVGTSSFWVALAATVETICSSVVLLWLYLHIRSIQKMSGSDFTGTMPTHIVIGSESASASQVASPRRSPNPQYKSGRCEGQGSNQPPFMFLDPRFRNVILRIALYPIISLIMNYTTVAADLYVSIFNVVNQRDFRILVLDLTLYGLRGFAYGVLAASDPAFIQALKAAIGRSASRKEKVTPADTVKKTGLTSLHFAANPKVAERSHRTTTSSTGNVVSDLSRNNLHSDLESHAEHLSTVEDLGRSVERYL